MSLWIIKHLLCIYKAIKCKNSLSKHDSIKSKETFSRSFLRGSFTLEAAVILPLIAAFLVGILFFFRVMQVQTEIGEALVYAGRTASAEEGSVVLADLRFRNEIKDYELVDKYVENLTLIRSEDDDNNLTLRADYLIKFPVGFFSIKGISGSQCSYNRKWTGKDVLGQDDEDKYVYYTDTGIAYHLSDKCSYLDLSIHSVEKNSIDYRRNKSGGKYYPCSACCKNTSLSGTVYITDYGTLYHRKLGCSRLKRTIHMCKISEVGGRKLCSKCGAAH